MRVAVEEEADVLRPAVCRTVLLHEGKRGGAHHLQALERLLERRLVDLRVGLRPHQLALVEVEGELTLVRVVRQAVDEAHGQDVEPSTLNQK